MQPISPLFVHYESTILQQCRQLPQIILSNDGKVAEQLVKECLIRILPPTMNVVNGLLMDSRGNRSDEIDCIVVAESAPRFPVDEFGSFFVVPVETAVAAVEVKFSATLASWKDCTSKFRKILQLECLAEAGRPKYPFLSCLMVHANTLDLRTLPLVVNQDVNMLIGILGTGMVLSDPVDPYCPVAVHASLRDDSLAVLGPGSALGFLVQTLLKRPSPARGLHPFYVSGSWSPMDPALSLEHKAAQALFDLYQADKDATHLAHADIIMNNIDSAHRTHLSRRILDCWKAHMYYFAMMHITDEWSLSFIHNR